MNSAKQGDKSSIFALTGSSIRKRGSQGAFYGPLASAQLKQPQPLLHGHSDSHRKALHEPLRLCLKIHNSRSDRGPNSIEQHPLLGWVLVSLLFQSLECDRRVDNQLYIQTILASLFWFVFRASSTYQFEEAIQLIQASNDE